MINRCLPPESFRVKDPRFQLDAQKDRPVFVPLYSADEHAEVSQLEQSVPSDERQVRRTLSTARLSMYCNKEFVYSSRSGKGRFILSPDDSTSRDTYLRRCSSAEHRQSRIVDLVALPKPESRFPTGQRNFRRANDVTTNRPENECPTMGPRDSSSQRMIARGTTSHRATKCSDRTTNVSTDASSSATGRNEEHPLDLCKFRHWSAG